MRARKGRWRSGKKDSHPGSKDGSRETKMAAREAKKRAGKLKSRREASEGVREATKRAGKPQNPSGWRKRGLGREKRRRRASCTNVQEPGPQDRQLRSRSSIRQASEVS